MNVTRSHQGRVGIVTINRPEVRNAVDRPTADALTAAVRSFDADDRVDVLVLTGADGNFCAGADLGAMTTPRANAVSADMADDGPMGPTRLVTAKPVIAAVEGYAVAGGLELAIWCDLRVAAADAVFGVFCRRWGVPLVDGGTVRLPRLIGAGRAMDMILTGRRVDADEAHRIGLVDRVCAPGQALTTAVALAESIAAHPQTCVRSDRESAAAQWGLSAAEALAGETALGLATIRSPEMIQGIGRFVAGAGRGGT